MGSLIHNATALMATAALAGGQGAATPTVRLECGEMFAKATPMVEGGQRVLYMEASSQARDVQNERILASALAESKDYFLRYGRIDLDHATVWQAIRETKLDPSNPYIREVGKPLDVKITGPKDDPRILVKAAIFRSTDPNNEFTKASDFFWNSLTLDPPMVWYPSVAGSLLGAHHESDGSGRRIRVINKLRWHSIAMTRTPVNTGIGPISTVPLDVFCKALQEGSDISSALAALAAGGSPDPADADSALRAAGIMVPATDGGSVAPGLQMTAREASLIEQSILQARPPFSVGEWLQDLVSTGISPQKGMAYLIALLDTHNSI